METNLERNDSDMDDMTASVSRMSPACLFVLSAATSHLRPQTLVEPPIDLDWNQVIEFADHHGLIPLVCRNLHLRGIRVQASSALDARCRETGAKGLRLTAGLIQIVTLFSDHQIPVLAIKGPSLASLLYSNVTMRSYADLDFLLLPGDVSRARGALQAAGWIPTEDVAMIHEPSFLRFQCEYGFVRNETLIELQWALAPRFFSLELPLDDMIRRAVTVQVIGSPVKTLAPEDMFLMLSVHGAKHLWIRLDWVVDIASLLSSGTVDANRVAELAQRHHLVRIVAIAVLLAGDVSGVRIPAPFSALAAKDPIAPMIASKLLDNAINGAQSYPPETLAYFRMSANLRERWRDRVRLFIRLLLTPSSSEWRLAHLPRGTHWLYGPVRIVRLAKRFLCGTW